MIFENWPYLNFHEKNLDWIIRTLKEQGVKIEDLAQVVEDLKSTVSQDVADILQEMYDDGTLETLIAAYMQHKTWMVADILSIPADVTLQYGDTVNTPTASYQYVSSGGVTLGGKHYIPNYYSTPQDIGLLGDGSANENSKIANLMAAFGVVDLKGARVLMTGSATVPDNGGLMNGIMIWGPNLNIALNANTKSNIVLKNMVFDMSNSTVAGTKIQIIDCDGVTIDNCEMYGWYGVACRLNGSKNVNITNTYVRDSSGTTGNPGTAFYMQGGEKLTARNCHSKALADAFIYLDGSTAVKNIIIDNILAEDHTGTANPHAISVYGDVSNISISNIIIRDCDYGIRLMHRANALPSAVTIANVSIYNTNTGNGIEIIGDPDAGTPMSFLGVINDVQMYHCAQDGLSLNNIRGGEFSNMHISAARNGVRAINASYMLLTAIYVALASNYDYCGMFFDADARGNMIIACYLHKRSGGGTATTGYQDRNVTSPYNTFALCKIQGSNVVAEGFDCSHSIIQLPSGNALAAQPVSLSYGTSANKPNYSLFDGYNLIASDGSNDGWRYQSGNWVQN